MKVLTTVWIIVLLASIGVLVNGQRELRLTREALQGANQELAGQVIVMVASGWSTWPTLPQCTYGQDNEFTNEPCLYGGMKFPDEEPVRETVPPELPVWLLPVSR
jgi:hypothetical protein